ncbi:MAG TPA: hypothetical protein DHV62_04370 [Elusimicrobia bacterium]|nr:hypothetical protein [Elusimicrobiota bacterium]
MGKNIMKVRIIKGTYGEGWLPGDVVNMDYAAAIVRLQNGDMVEVEENTPVRIKVLEEVKGDDPSIQPEKRDTKEQSDDKTCNECGYVAKNKNGLRLHKKKHSPKQV